MERTRIQDLVIGIVVALIGVYGVVKAVAMPDGTRPYTLVVMSIFTFLGVLLTCLSIYKRKTPSADAEAVHVKVMKNPMIAFLMILVYVLLMNVIGFFVTSALFMVVMMLWMGYRKPIVMVLTVVGMLAFIYVLFVHQLNVTLPSGVLF